MALKSELYRLLDNAGRLCGDCREAGELARCIRDMRARLERPLRVAVVGIMKAGKSTFLNALMGAPILYTGSLETTYTVCWFRYGEKPSVTVCFRDGEEMQVPFSELELWSVRTSEKDNPRIREVRYLIIYYPGETLKKMEFIDTPGLNSAYGTDAQNTLDFLSLKGSEDTLSEASEADAVIYAFSRSAAGFDREILSSFHGGGISASPVNSLGILTKVDASGIWDIFSGENPVIAAGPVAASVMGREEMKKLLFTVLPVCAKAVEGCMQLSGRDWELLKEMTRTEEEELQELLFDAGEFASGTDEALTRLATQKDRESLINKLGQYGILETVRQLRAGRSGEQTIATLRDACGITAVKEMVQRHFGNRTFLIKARYILDHMMAVTARIRKENPGSRLSQICLELREEIEELTTSVQPLKELKVLQMYYNGQIRFQSDEEQRDFLRLTGEYGRTPESRLGMPEGSTVSELREAAREKASLWHGKASGFMMPGTYVEAASVLARSCEQMYYHLNALTEE